MSLKTNITVLVWKSNTALNFPDGTQTMISCNHTPEGYYGVNIRGEVFPLPNTDIPPLAAGAASDYQHQTVLVKAGNTYGPVTPFASDDPNFKACIRVTDNVKGITYYVDAADYASKIGQCNNLPYAATCGLVTNLSAGTPATTSATITWADYPGSAAIEYVNNTSSSAPAGHGTLLPAGTQTIAITGLTAATSYHFWIRTVCAGGTQGAWTSLTYTTHA